MVQGAKDSHLKNPPDSDNYDMKVARIRMKGFHEDAKDGNELDAIAVYPVNPFGNPIINEMQVKTVPGGTSTRVVEFTANDSDKSFAAVPDDELREVDSILVHYTATATVGNRILTVIVTNAASQVVYNIAVSAAITATAAVYYNLYPTAPVLATGTSRYMPMPVLHLQAGDVLRIADTSAIDAAADDMELSIHYIEYDA